MARVGGKFQNIGFETPTALGIVGSVEGRIIGAVYTPTEGYSASLILNRPCALPQEQSWLLPAQSLLLLNAVPATVRCLW